MNGFGINLYSLRNLIQTEEGLLDTAIKLREIRETRGYDAILSEVCSLDPDGELGKLIKEKIALIKEWGWLA